MELIEKLDNLPREVKEELEKIKKEYRETATSYYKEFERVFNTLSIQKNKEKIDKACNFLKKAINAYKTNKIDIKKFADIFYKFVYEILNLHPDKVGIVIYKSPQIYASIYYNFIIGKKGGATVKISTGLLLELTVDEIIAVLLHEFGHLYYVHKKEIKYGKIKNINNIINFVNIIISSIIYYIISSEIKEKEKLKKFTKMFVGYITSTTFMFYIVNLIFSYLQIKYTEKAETFADYYATYCGYGHALSSALNKMDKNRKPLSTKKFMLILSRFFRRLIFRDPHEPVQIRMCRVIKHTLADPSIKNTKIYDTLVNEYKQLKCGDILQHV